MSVDYSKYEFLSIHLDEGILNITLNRPEHYNAIHHELHRELSNIFYEVALDDDVAVVVLTGAGKAFCAGGDLKAMQNHAAASGVAGHYLSSVDAKRIVYGLLDLEKPVIAKINGPAIGLGATIALFSDITYMADHTVIADPHVQVGVVAGDGGAIIWPQLIGYSRAKEFLMTGDSVTAQQAERMGLVNHVLPAAELDATVQNMAQRLVDGPRDAIRWTKTTINIGLRQLAHSIFDASMAYEMVTLRSASHKEALTAFSEGRAPVFKVA